MLERIKWRVFGSILVAVGLGLFFWHSPLLLPLKLLAVTLHETGHAIAAYAMGGHVERIAINRYQGGIAHIVYQPTLWRTFIIASSGYLGSAFFGAVLLRISVVDNLPLPKKRSGFFYKYFKYFSGPKTVFYLLGGGLLIISILFFRDSFSWFFAISTASLLLIAARFFSGKQLQPGAIFISTFTCLYALFDLRDDVLRMPWESRKPGRTDADILAEILILPAWFWGALWSLIALFLIAWTLRSSIFRPESRKKTRFFKKNVNLS